MRRCSKVIYGSDGNVVKKPQYHQVFITVQSDKILLLPWRQTSFKNEKIVLLFPDPWSCWTSWNHWPVAELFHGIVASQQLNPPERNDSNRVFLFRVMSSTPWLLHLTPQLPRWIHLTKGDSLRLRTGVGLVSGGYRMKTMTTDFLMGSDCSSGVTLKSDGPSVFWTYRKHPGTEGQTGSDQNGLVSLKTLVWTCGLTLKHLIVKLLEQKTQETCWTNQKTRIWDIRDQSPSFTETDEVWTEGFVLHVVSREG